MYEAESPSPASPGSCRGWSGSGDRERSETELLVTPNEPSFTFGQPDESVESPRIAGGYGEFEEEERSAMGKKAWR